MVIDVSVIVSGVYLFIYLVLKVMLLKADSVLLI